MVSAPLWLLPIAIVAAVRFESDPLAGVINPSVWLIVGWSVVKQSFRESHHHLRELGLAFVNFTCHPLSFYQTSKGEKQQ
jgi:hypothetical protein